MWALLRSRDLSAYAASMVLALAAFMLMTVAVPYQAYALTHSSAVVGALAASDLVPVLALGFLSGAVADAFDRRRVLVVSGLGCAASAAVLACGDALGRPHVWVLFAGSVGVAACAAVMMPAARALLPRLVEPGELTAAASVVGAGETAAQLAAPAAAGVLVAAAGTETVYVAAVALLLVAAAAGLVLRAVPAPADASLPSVARIAEGLRYARSRPDLVGTYLVDMAAMFFGMPTALLPQLASRLGGASALGLLTSAPALGALAATLAGRRLGRVRRQGRALVVAAAGWGLAVAALGLADDLVLAAAALAVSGALDMVSGLMRMTIWNTTIPDALRGRLAGVEMISYSAGPSLGNLEGGVVASVAGLDAAIVAGGVACVLCTAALGALLPDLWRYDSSTGVVAARPRQDSNLRPTA